MEVLWVGAAGGLQDLHQRQNLLPTNCSLPLSLVSTGSTHGLPCTGRPPPPPPACAETLPAEPRPCLLSVPVCLTAPVSLDLPVCVSPSCPLGASSSELGAFCPLAVSASLHWPCVCGGAALAPPLSPWMVTPVGESEWSTCPSQSWPAGVETLGRTLGALRAPNPSQKAAIILPTPQPPPQDPLAQGGPREKKTRPGHAGVSRARQCWFQERATSCQHRPPPPQKASRS